MADHTESIETDATPEEAYVLVAAVDRVPDHSPECRRIEWISDDRQPRVGARFRGQNRWRGFRWWREVHIVTTERGRAFAFRTVPGRGIYNDSTAWRYDFELTAAGVRVTEGYDFTAPAWIRRMDRVLGRPKALANGMRATLAALKETAEAP